MDNQNNLPPGWGEQSENKNPWANKFTVENNSETVQSESQQGQSFSNVNTDNFRDNEQPQYAEAFQSETAFKSKAITHLVLPILAVVLVVGGFIFFLSQNSTDDNGGVATGNSTATSEEKTNINGNDQNSTVEVSTVTTTESNSNPTLDGQALAEEFLMQFPTLFMGTTVPVANSWGSESGQFISQQKIALNEWGFWEYADREIITYEVPDIYHCITADESGYGYFVEHGNRITDTDTIWLGGWDSYATSFSLYDFDDDDIPEIIVKYASFLPRGGLAIIELFKFIDGEYRRVSTDLQSGDDTEYSYWADISDYYFDNNNNLISFTRSNEYMGTSAKYNQIIFNNDVANINPVATENYDWNTGVIWWENHVTGETNIPSDNDVDPNSPHLLPGTDNLLTPIQPLTDMKEEITSSVKQRLGY